MRDGVGVARGDRPIAGRASSPTTCRRSSRTRPSSSSSIDGRPICTRRRSGARRSRRDWRSTPSLDLCRRAGRDCLLDSGGARVTASVDPELSEEAYRLTVDGDAVGVVAATTRGFVHGFVTLAQWLASGLPAAATVADAPRYAFRGLHIDLARQWFEPAVVDRLIDVAAWRKLSRLHLHLSDDEGWRLPVESLPELATEAAVRGHGLALPPMLGGGPEPSGRAYTRDEIAAMGRAGRRARDRARPRGRPAGPRARRADRVAGAPRSR